MTAASIGVADVPAGRRWVVWTGRVLSAVPVLLMAFGAYMTSVASPEMVAAFTGHYGYPRSAILGIALAQIACAVLYVVPQTAVFGAILMTGYLGGAVATHVRAGESFVMAVAVGVLAWAGLYLRDARLRELLPIRRRTAARRAAVE